MSARKTFALCAAIGLLAAGAVVWKFARGGSAPAVDEAPLPEAGAASAGLLANPAVAHEGGARFPSLVEGTSGRGRGPLVVRVTAAYEPRAGVAVRVRRVDTLHPRATATTDSRGLVRLGSVDRGSDVVEAVAEGFRPTSTEREGFQERDGVLDLTLEPAVPVAGRVVDAATGEPIAGASVVVRLASYPYEIGVTDASGRFVIPGLWEGADAEVAATAPGRSPARARVGLPEGDAPMREPVLRMGFGGALVGTVVTADGTAASGVEVAVFQTPQSEINVPGRVLPDGTSGLPRGSFVIASAPTRSDGAFRVEGLEADSEYELFPRGGGFVAAATTPIRTTACGDAGPLTLGVLRAATVRVRLIPPYRPGVAYPSSWLVRGASMRATEVTEEGDFLCVEVRPGPVEAVVRAHGYFTTRVQGTAVEGEETLLIAQMLPLGSISGVVIDDVGRPVPGAEVGVWVMDSDPPWRAPGVRTDDRGRFAIPQANGEETGLVATWTDETRPTRMARSVEKLRVRGPASDVRLVVVPRGWIRVRAIGIRSESQDAWAALRRVDAPAGWNPTQLDEGVFERGDLDDGEYELLVAVPGFAWEHRFVSIERGRPIDLGDVVLQKGLHVRGRVVDSHGRPLSARVTAAALSHISLALMRGRRTKTDAQGRFTLPHVPASDAIELEIEADLHSPRRVSATPGSEEEIEVRLPREARLTGTLKAPADTDFDGLPLVLRRMAAEIAADGTIGDSEEIQSIDFDESGAFGKWLTRGTWTAVFTDRAGAEHVLGSWTLAEGAEVEIVLRLPGH